MKTEWHDDELHLVITPHDIDAILHQEQAIEMALARKSLEDLEAMDIDAEPHLVTWLEKEKSRLRSLIPPAIAIRDAVAQTHGFDAGKDAALAYLRENSSPDLTDIAGDYIIPALAERMTSRAINDEGTD